MALEGGTEAGVWEEVSPTMVGGLAMVGVSTMRRVPLQILRQSTTPPPTTTMGEQYGYRVFKRHRLTVVRRRKILLTPRKILRFLCTSWKIHDFNNFCPFLPTLFRDLLAIFLRKVFNNKKCDAAKKIHF